MPKVKSRQSGSFNMGSTTTQQDVTISSVVTSKSIVIVQVEGSESIYDADSFCITGKLTSSTNLRFNRYATVAAGIDVWWQVIEYENSGGVTVDVQAGSLTLDSTTENVTISSVDTSKSFSIAQVRGDTFTSTMDGIIYRHMITSSTNLQVDGTETSSNNVMEWQVVEFSDASVQALSGTTTNATYTDVTISSVTTDDSFLMVSYSDSGSTIDLNQLKGARIYSSTAVRLSAYVAGQMYYGFYVISSTNYVVQRGWTGVTGASLNVDITAVTQSKCLLNLGGIYNNYQTVDSYEENIQEFGFRISFVDSDTIILDRDSSTNGATVSWEVIEFSDPVSARRIFITS